MGKCESIMFNFKVNDCNYDAPLSPHDYCAIGNSAKKFVCENCPPPPCLPTFPASPPCPVPTCWLWYLFLLLCPVLLASLYTIFFKRSRAPDKADDHAYEDYPPTMNASTRQKYRFGFLSPISKSKVGKGKGSTKNLIKSGQEDTCPQQNAAAVGPECTSTTEHEYEMNIGSRAEAAKRIQRMQPWTGMCIQRVEQWRTIPSTIDQRSTVENRVQNLWEVSKKSWKYEQKRNNREFHD